MITRSSSAPSAPTVPAAPSVPVVPSEEHDEPVLHEEPRPYHRVRGSATGPVRGPRPRPGSVEYEVYRSQSKGGYPYRWRKFDALATRDIEVTLRVNRWEHEVLRYVVGGLEHRSLASFLLEHGMRAALKLIIKHERGDAGEGDDAG